MGVVAVDVDLGVEVEGDVVFGQHASFDLRVSAGLLSSKLVAGESGYSQPLRFIASVQSLKLIVVGVGQPSVGCHVQDDHHFAPIFIEADTVSIDGVGIEIVNGLPTGRRQKGAEKKEHCSHDRIFRD